MRKLRYGQPIPLLFIILYKGDLFQCSIDILRDKVIMNVFLTEEFHIAKNVFFNTYNVLL